MSGETPLSTVAESSRALNVISAFMVSQSALETGWGRKEIRHADGTPSFNLFGIKASAGWDGAVADATTTEYVGGKANRQLERFRSYGSYAEAFNDWATLVANSPRYGNVARTGASAGQFVHVRPGHGWDPLLRRSSLGCRTIAPRGTTLGVAWRAILRSSPANSASTVVANLSASAA